MMIVNDDSSGVSEQSFYIIDDARGVIYDRHMFIIQATGDTMKNGQPPKCQLVRKSICQEVNPCIK